MLKNLIDRVVNRIIRESESHEMQLTCKCKKDKIYL